MLAAWTLIAQIVEELTNWTLWALTRGTLATFAAAIGLSVWHALPLSTNPDMAIVNGTWTVFAVSAMCYVVSRFRSHTAGLLLAALMATRDDVPPPAHLAAVPSPDEASQSSSHAAAG